MKQEQLSKNSEATSGKTPRLLGVDIFVTKDAYKFSAAHWTVFPDGSKEALHGHNYMVGLRVRVRDTHFASMVDFRLLKRALRPLCEAWDEKIMLPTRNPHVTIKDLGVEYEVIACGKRYVFPKDETVLVPCENISAEQLAEVFGMLYTQSIGQEYPKVFAQLVTYEITISETAGQGASISLSP